MKPPSRQPPLEKPAAGKPATGTPATATAAATLARLRGDHLLLWTAYAAVPITWLAVALVAPAFLLAVPLVALGLVLCFRFGILERFPAAEDELDF